MKFSYEWLLSHIDTSFSASEVAEKLTSLGIEVQEIVDNSEKFKNFVVGNVVECDRHPNADKLKVCKVDVGNGSILNVVCGANNARPGITVVVALDGAVVPESGFTIKKGKIRGVESEGMMCSAHELCISNETDGIIELQSGLISGAKLPFSNDDIIFDVGVTPNRGDCFSVRGIARLLASANCGSIKPLKVNMFTETINDEIKVDIQTESCKYFSVRVIDNITQCQKTPTFIANRLAAIGQKLIYPPVDVANYICLDIGQPLHIFDRDLIGDLVIRDSKDGETINTLDGNLVKISKDTILVANNDHPLSIAGIIGGVESSFSNCTKCIAIEAAYFDKAAISVSGQRMRINSDSRIRNERGIDPEGVDLAMDYATSLICEIYPLCGVGKTTKFGVLPNNRNKITVYFEKFKNITGFSAEVWEKIPSILPCEVVSADKTKIDVVTPSYRHDLSIEEDIIEEVLILSGYDNIEGVELEYADSALSGNFDEKVSDILNYNGYFEVKTFSFIDKQTALLFDKHENIVELLEPLNNEFAVLRPTIAASLLKSLKNNQNKGQESCSFFEIGKKFSKNDGEKNMLSIIVSGKISERNWNTVCRDVSIFDIKQSLEKILSAANINNFKIKTNNVPCYYHPGRSGVYTSRNGASIAYFGEIHPKILKTLGMSGPIVFAEVFLDTLSEIGKAPKNGALALSSYQPITRDFSFVIDKDVTADAITSAIKKTNVEFVQNIGIFDVYEIDETKKSIGVYVTLQPIKSTLNSEEIQKISERIVHSVEIETGGVLRS